MALSADDFNRESRHSRGRTCGMAAILGALSPKDVEVLSAALVDPNVTHEAIARVLTSNGQRAKANMVARHRKGACCCGDR